MKQERTNEVHQHVPLSSVIGWIGEQELNQAPVHRLLPLRRLHTGVEEVIATLNLFINVRSCLSNLGVENKSNNCPCEHQLKHTQKYFQNKAFKAATAERGAAQA